MNKPEDLLIRSCCHLEIDADAAEKIASMISPALRWAYFLDKARQEKVAPLLYRAFSKNKTIKACIPQDVLAELKAVYYTVLGRNILNCQNLENIAGKLNKTGMPFFILKGLSLAETVYKDLGLRSTGDLDILVTIQDVPKVDCILGELGYKKSFIFDGFSRLSYSAYRNSFLYHNPDAPAKYIHLFWHIINLYPHDKDILGRIDMDTIWKAAKEIKTGDIRFFTLSACHQIIYLCLHALTHSYKPFILLCDINEFIGLEKDNIDWSVLVNEAFEFGLSKYVYYGLYLTKEILGADIPPDTLLRLRPRRMSFFEQMFIRRVLNGKRMIGRRYALFLLYLGMNETAAQRFKFARGICFPPKSELSVIRQKKASCLPVLDYMQRILFGG